MLRERDSHSGVRVPRAAIASPPQAPPAAGVCRQVPPFQGGTKDPPWCRTRYFGTGLACTTVGVARRGRIGHDWVNRVATLALASRMPGYASSPSRRWRRHDHACGGGVELQGNGGGFPLELSPPQLVARRSPNYAGRPEWQRLTSARAAPLTGPCPESRRQRPCRNPSTPLGLRLRDCRADR